MTEYSYAWSLTNEERFEVMVLAQLQNEGLSIWSDWPEIKKCFENVASPNKCLEVMRGLRDNLARCYFCKGCKADITEIMWCNCGEFALFRDES